MFIDEAVIQVRAGRGGDGAVSFRREKFVPKGGPDGGDGGTGGDVYLLADENMRTLLTFRHQSRFVAGHGAHGGKKQMSGAGGEDVVIRVPVGTIVQEGESLRPIADLAAHDQRVRVARGGRGGKGNVHFKSSTRRAPRIATEGRDGEERSLRLTLKLLADVGLVGLPNVGKSTLLRRLSNATPKIGDFPFTTLRPNLGIVPLGEYDSMVMADLPGLVAGAHQGRGLGLRFLRHIERTRLLLFLIDSAAEDPQRDLHVLLEELGSFSAALLERPRIVAYSRGDLVPSGNLPALDGAESPRFSAVSGEGVPSLLALLRERLDAIRAAEPQPTARTDEPPARTEDAPAPADEALEPFEGWPDSDAVAPTPAVGLPPGLAGLAALLSLSRGGGLDPLLETAAAPPAAMKSGRGAVSPAPRRVVAGFFADRVDAGAPLGPTPWPKDVRVEVEE